MVTMSGGNINQRLRGFMKSGDDEELKLKREWHYVELRKNKRTELALKRRRLWDSSTAPGFNDPQLEEQLTSLSRDIAGTNPLPALNQLETIGRGDDKSICELMVRAGLVPVLIRLLRDEKDPIVVTKAVEILCDLLYVVAQETPIEGIGDLVDLSFALLEERKELTSMLILIISNVVSDQRCLLATESLAIWVEKVLSSLHLDSHEDETADKLWCLGSFLQTNQLSAHTTESIIGALRHYCELPCSKTWVPPLVRCLKWVPSADLCRPEIVNYLLKGLLIYPGNGSIYELLKEAYSSGVCSVDRLYTVLNYSLEHEKTSTRRFAYDMLYSSLDFYEDIRRDAVLSQVWQTAVKGLADQDGYIQMAAANFYSSFDSDYACHFAEIMEDLLKNLRSLDQTQDPGAQLVVCM